MDSQTLNLTPEQGEKLLALDAAIGQIRDGFDAFKAAAIACEEAEIPQAILVGKAQEMQGAIMQGMT